MLSQEITTKYQNKALEALARIKNEGNIEETKRTSSVPPVYDRYIFESFTNDGMEEKIKHDTSYYNILFKNIEESDSDLAHTLLGKLLKTTKLIYEHINIQPKIFGSKAIALNESDDIIEKNALRMIDEFIDSNYYSLSQERRDSTYKEKVIAESETLISENAANPEEAVEFCYKSVVMEGLLEKISFPSIIKYKIDEVLSSDIDNQVFEQDELSELWTSFQSQSKKLAKLIATTV